MHVLRAWLNAAHTSLETQCGAVYQDAGPFRAQAYVAGPPHLPAVPRVHRVEGPSQRA